jgi:hypothetical protein
MAKVMNGDEKKQMNLNSLQKEDKSITNILGQATHIVLYQFEKTTSQWDRIGVEGSGFVVTASTSPVLRLLVLNRLGTYISFSLGLTPTQLTSSQIPTPSL